MFGVGSPDGASDSGIEEDKAGGKVQFSFN